MKKVLHMTVLIAGLAGLSACASNDRYSDTSRTSMGSDMSAQLAACNERVARLEEMNKACYRK